MQKEPPGGGSFYVSASKLGGEIILLGSRPEQGLQWYTKKRAPRGAPLQIGRFQDGRHCRLLADGHDVDPMADTLLLDLTDHAAGDFNALL
jgi:hypothetical protein